MSLAHFVYIPALLLVGIVIGYILGGRAAEGARSENADKARRREARRARRDREQVPPS
jgi:hypothetical protein